MSLSLPPLLVSAGEASGDRIAAGVVRALGIAACGLGGDALAASGASVEIPLRTVSGMGFGAPLRMLPHLAWAAKRLLALVSAHAIRAALLVNFTEFNAYLGRHLRRRGVRVLWAVAPQVWAWRRARRQTLCASFDRLAVLFPFELDLWSQAGTDVHWVGHPVLDAPIAPVSAARTALELPQHGPTLALLPGSRASEVGRLLPPMLTAAEQLRIRFPDLSSRLLIAPSLPRSVEIAARRAAAGVDVRCVAVSADAGMAPYLAAFDVALCASGTATLEAALGGAAPVIAYRLDPLSAFLARRLIRLPHMGLPNVLLGRRAYPELFQEQVTPTALEDAACRLLYNPSRTRGLQHELRDMLQHPGPGTAVERMADLLRPWA